MLTPTNDVVASPPLASLQPNTDYTVRVVRTRKDPAVKEEAYRLLVDELRFDKADLITVAADLLAENDKLRARH